MGAGGWKEQEGDQLLWSGSLVMIYEMEADPETRGYLCAGTNLDLDLVDPRGC